MSFEEHYQCLCSKGHYWETDVYEDRQTCPICNTKYVWQNLVDETNGSFDINDDGKLIRIDGKVELKVKEKKVCNKCRSILEIRYKIPKR